MSPVVVLLDEKVDAWEEKGKLFLEEEVVAV